MFNSLLRERIKLKKILFDEVEKKKKLGWVEAQSKLIANIINLNLIMFFFNIFFIDISYNITTTLHEK